MATAARYFDRSNGMDGSLAVTGPSHPALTTELSEGQLALTGRLLQASNATFLGQLTTKTGEVACVYKPFQGERPLWDFPTHTLALREVAAYRVSQAGGFDVVPVTVLADGQFGVGSLQVWVEVEQEDANQEDTGALIDLVPADTVPRPGYFEIAEGLDGDEQPVALIHADDPRLRLMAAFDVLVNNADRKGGHILPSQGRVFGVDHGVTFHVEPKLRTLLWGWAGLPIPETELACIRRARDHAADACEGLLTELEIMVLIDRAEDLISAGCFPEPGGGWPAIPWPPF